MKAYLTVMLFVLSTFVITTPAQERSWQEESRTSFQLRGGATLLAQSTQSGAKTKQKFVTGFSFPTFFSRYVGTNIGVDFTERSFVEQSTAQTRNYNTLYYDSFIGPLFRVPLLNDGMLTVGANLLVAVPDSNYEDRNFRQTNRVFYGSFVDAIYWYHIHQYVDVGLGAFSKIDLWGGIRPYRGNSKEYFRDHGLYAAISIPLVHWSQLDLRYDKSDDDFKKAKESR